VGTAVLEGSNPVWWVSALPGGVVLAASRDGQGIATRSALGAGSLVRIYPCLGTPMFAAAPVTLANELFIVGFLIF
jgi:hypothetical protein